MQEPSLVDQFQFHMAMEAAAESFREQVLTQAVSSVIRFVLGPAHMEAVLANPPAWFEEWAERTGAAITSGDQDALCVQMQDYILRALGAK